MHKLYTFAALIGFSFLLFSFSTNPPDGNTGAPGDQLCIQCHNHTNPQQNGTLTMEGFPESITPNETYSLKIINRLTEGTAKRGGFQVTILGPFNTRAGDMSVPSQSSIVSITANRQYWDHNPAKEYPDSNVVSWTVLWKAPDLAPGSLITWYAAGNIADGNFQNTGDRIITAHGSGAIVLSATENIPDDKLVIYPNPGNDEINIVKDHETAPDGKISFFNLSGRMIAETEMESGQVNTSFIPAGVYLLRIHDGDRSHFSRWSKM